MSQASKQRRDEQGLKKEQNFSDLEDDREQNRQQREECNIQQTSTLKRIKYWMGDSEPIKLVKLSEEMMTRVLQNWSKFRITVLKAVNEEQSKILDSMARLRKQVQWMNQVHADKVPDASTKCTLRLFKQLKKIVEQLEDGDIHANKSKIHSFNLKKMYKQSKLITDKLLDSAKVIFEGIKEGMRKMTEQTRQLVGIEQLLTQRTYFRFLSQQKHSLISVVDEESITVHNEGYDMDFGAVAGPTLTQNNNKVAFSIDANDKYQCFIGLGVCHPEIVKEQIYKGSSIGSGAYLIRQENQPTEAIALSHAYDYEGTHKKLRKLKWGFGQGDVICIQMDVRKGRVYFTKAGHEDCTHQMKINMKEGPVAPYVVLHTKWDRVSLVNY